MLLNVFDSDAFTMHSLTAAINKLPYQPQRLGELKLFNEKGVSTTSVDAEEQSGRLSLIQTSARGGVAADPLGSKKRTMRTFKCQHLERDSKVYADEIQNVRAFGSETETQLLSGIVSDRLAELVSMQAVTLEFQRMGALQGIILDADLTTIYNLFTEFGVTQQTLAIALSGATTDVRGRIVAAKRLAEGELGGQVVRGFRAFCGANFFDALVSHPNVIAAYQYQQGQVLAADLRYTGFSFGGVIWEEYRSGVVKPDSLGGASVNFVDPDQAWLVPDTDIYITRFAPADYEETVNTMGLPYYAKQVPDPSGLGKYRQVNTQSNPISLCLRPRSVIKLTKS